MAVQLQTEMEYAQSLDFVEQQLVENSVSIC